MKRSFLSFRFKIVVALFVFVMLPMNIGAASDTALVFFNRSSQLKPSPASANWGAVKGVDNTIAECSVTGYAKGVSGVLDGQNPNFIMGVSARALLCSDKGGKTNPSGTPSCHAVSVIPSRSNPLGFGDTSQILCGPKEYVAGLSQGVPDAPFFPDSIANTLSMLCCSYSSVPMPHKNIDTVNVTSTGYQSSNRGTWAGPGNMSGSCGGGKYMIGIARNTYTVGRIFCAEDDSTSYKIAEAAKAAAAEAAKAAAAVAARIARAKHDTVLTFDVQNDSVAPLPEGPNWGAGAIKAECSKYMEVVGFSKYSDDINGSQKSHALFCGQGAGGRSDSSTSCHEVAFSGTLNMNGDPAITTDWDENYYKGTCNANEYVAGLSQSSEGSFQSMLCCSSPNVSHTHTNISSLAYSNSPNSNAKSQGESRSQKSWDGTYLQLTCGSGRYIIGVSHGVPLPHTEFSAQSNGSVHAILCAGGALPLK